jgi:ribosomal protein S18 acetylase RimI-like enzyme
LEALTEAPYAFGSTLDDWQGKCDTETRWRGRLAEVPFNIVADWQEAAAGMASGTAPNPTGSVELLSMWVAPFARGRGIGEALVTAVLEWGRQARASKVELGVFESNEHALALYRRCGFVDAGSQSDHGRGTPTERRLVRFLDFP